MTAAAGRIKYVNCAANRIAISHDRRAAPPLSDKRDVYKRQLYTFLAEGLPDNHAMMLTIPFVLYGIFRYLYLIHIRNEGGAPEEILLRDRPFQVNLLFYGLTVFVALYLLA